MPSPLTSPAGDTCWAPNTTVEPVSILELPGAAKAGKGADRARVKKAPVALRPQILHGRADNLMVHEFDRGWAIPCPSAEHLRTGNRRVKGHHHPMNRAGFHRDSFP
jgi:hypothetical protein